MATVSACVIAKNEAANIARCLKSIKEIVKEMIVVDTGSTDDTISIAEKLGAKIFHYEWNDDFAAARNYALEQATGNWILFLDADEYIPEDKVKNIPALIARINGNRKVSSIVCLMQHTDGFNGPVKCYDKTVRLFRNSPAIRYQGRIHEMIYKHEKKFLAYYVAKEKLLIIHTGYKSIGIADKIRRNLILLEKDLADGNIHDLTYHYLSHSYSLLGQHDKAIEFARKALAEGSVAKSMFAHKIYLILIHSLQQTSNCSPDTVEPILNEILQKYPHHPEVIECQANYFLTQGYYTKALKTFFQALKANENYKDIQLANDFYSHIPFVYANVAAIYDKMNNSTHALDYYVASLKRFKLNETAFNELLKLLRKQDVANTVYLLNSIYNIHEETDVGFLVTRLSVLKMLKLLTYYEKKWSENSHRNIIIEIKPFLQSKFEQAFQIFSSKFHETDTYETELMAVVSALLGNSPEWIKTLEPKLQPSFSHIVSIFFGVKNNALTPEDLPCYLDILDKICHISTENQMNHLLQVGFSCSLHEVPTKMTDILEKQRLFKEAISVYTYWINQSNCKAELKNLYYHAGYCYYKQKNYHQAFECFNKALEHGYDASDIHEYLNWINQQINKQNDPRKLKVSS